MAAGRTRSTRKLRAWIVEQVRVVVRGRLPVPMPSARRAMSDGSKIGSTQMIWFDFDCSSLGDQYVVILSSSHAEKTQMVLLVLCKLCVVVQVCSGKYPGLVWDDEAKTMFRIPWKHAGKQDFRKDEDAAIFKVRPA